MSVARRVDGFGAGLLRVLGGRFGLLERHALQIPRNWRRRPPRPISSWRRSCSFLLGVLLVLGIAVAILAHIERVEQIVDGVAEAALVVDEPFEPVEAAARFVLDDRTPQIDELLCRRRRRLPGQPLAHHHGDGVLDRRVGAVGDLVELAAMEAVVDAWRQDCGRRRSCGAPRSPPRAPARPRRTPRAPAGRRGSACDARPDRDRRA